MCSTAEAWEANRLLEAITGRVGYGLVIRRTTNRTRMSTEVVAEFKK